MLQESTTPTAAYIQPTIAKRCYSCGRTLPITEFYKNISTKDGHSSACKECHERGIRESKVRNKQDVLSKMQQREIIA